MITHKIIIYFYRFSKLRREEQTVFHRSGDNLFPRRPSEFLWIFALCCLPSLSWRMSCCLGNPLHPSNGNIYSFKMYLKVTSRDYHLWALWLFIAVLSMPVNIVKILLSLPLYLFDGVKTFLLGNSWADLLHRAIHISLFVLFLISSSQTRILRQFKNIEGKLRAHFRHVFERYKRRLKQS